MISIFAGWNHSNVSFCHFSEWSNWIVSLKSSPCFWMLELKKAELRCLILHCFFCFKIFLSVKPLFCGVIIYLTCIVIHQTKPKSMGIHHAKEFLDTLTYKTYTKCLKSHTNFWTPCINMWYLLICSCRALFCYSVLEVAD